MEWSKAISYFPRGVASISPPNMYYTYTHTTYTQVPKGQRVVPPPPCAGLIQVCQAFIPRKIDHLPVGGVGRQEREFTRKNNARHSVLYIEDRTACLFYIRRTDTLKVSPKSRATAWKRRRRRRRRRRRSRLLGGFTQNRCSERGGQWARLRGAAYVASHWRPQEAEAGILGTVGVGVYSRRRRSHKMSKRILAALLRADCREKWCQS